MIFSLDTDDYEAIKIDITEEDEEKELGEIVSEFCYAMASFFIDFSTKLNAKNKEQIDVLKDVCSSCIDNYIDIIANEVFNNPTTPGDEGMSDLLRKLQDANLSKEEIENILNLVKNCGSIEEATEYLNKLLNKI